jgi:replicative DNA helicase
MWSSPDVFGLCSLLLFPRDVLDLCQISLRSEAFYAPAHQTVYNLVAELVDGNKPVDFITLKQALKDRGQLDQIGGPEYLSDLLSLRSFRR